MKQLVAERIGPYFSTAGPQPFLRVPNLQRRVVVHRRVRLLRDDHRHHLRCVAHDADLPDASRASTSALTSAAHHSVFACPLQMQRALKSTITANDIVSVCRDTEGESCDVIQGHAVMHLKVTVLQSGKTYHQKTSCRVTSSKCHVTAARCNVTRCWYRAPASSTRAC